MSEPGSRRGRAHDAEGAREAILNAAEEVFAEHGFDGARVDAIAAAAGYNKSLIFQYFGDKLGLYAEVIRRADDQTRDMQVTIVGMLSDGESFVSRDRFKEVLKKFMGELFDYFQQNPRFVRIIQWEMAEGWQTYAKIFSQANVDDFEQFGPIMHRLQDAGLLRSDIDPLLQILTAEFLCMQYLACIPISQVFMPDQDLSSAESLATAREFLIDMVARGLLADPPEPKPKGD
jgi:AcrR family transcriptional regulator